MENWSKRSMIIILDCNFCALFYIYGRFSYFAVKYIFVLQDFIIRIIYSKYNYIFFTFLCIFSFTENENDCIIHHTNFVFTELMFCIELQKGKTVSKNIFMSKSFYLIVFHLNQILHIYASYISF